MRIDRHRFGLELLFEVQDVILRRRGLDIVEVLIDSLGSERAMVAVDRATAPQRVAAE